MAYKGRLAIIAGGLGGLGSETAKLLHAEGASLALLYAPFEADRRDKLLEGAFGNPAPDNVKTYEADITDEDAVAKAFAAINTDLSSQDPPVFPSILINAAGYVSVQPLTETSAAEAAKNILPNLLGPFIVSNAFYNLYTKTKSTGPKPPGRIVSISSQAAHVALPSHGAYCASKAGLLGLVRSQALEWGPEGITSNSVSPTVAMTELGRKAWADPEKRDDMLRQIPTGRFAEPDEIARAMEWLCRDGNGMLNGTDIRIDGGTLWLFLLSHGTCRPAVDFVHSAACDHESGRRAELRTDLLLLDRLYHTIMHIFRALQRFIFPLTLMATTDCKIRVCAKWFSA
jgi:NAD(P)-dependent dehydrogenase (short-subunit alcohol dehydrogenase family)